VDTLAPSARRWLIDSSLYGLSAAFAAVTAVAADIPPAAHMGTNRCLGIRRRNHDGWSRRPRAHAAVRGLGLRSLRGGRDLCFPLTPATASRRPRPQRWAHRCSISSRPGKSRSRWSLVSVIIGVVALLLVSGRGGSMSQACARAAGAFLVASALAPAARVGYLVYQLNLIAWAVVSDRHARAPTRTRRGLPFRTRVHDA
jgi:hypothetical protein